MNVKPELPPVRGSNQSTQTKRATLLVDEAMTLIESGGVQKGVDVLQRALDLLPDLALERQEAAVWAWLERLGWRAQ